MEHPIAQPKATPAGVRALLALSVCNIIVGPLAIAFLFAEKSNILLSPYLWLPLIFVWFASSYLFAPLGFCAIVWSCFQRRQTAARIRIAATVIGGLATSMFAAQYVMRTFNLRLH